MKRNPDSFRHPLTEKDADQLCVGCGHHAWLHDIGGCLGEDDLSERDLVCRCRRAGPGIAPRVTWYVQQMGERQYEAEVPGMTVLQMARIARDIRNAVAREEARLFGVDNGWGRWWDGRAIDAPIIHSPEYE